MAEEHALHSFMRQMSLEMSEEYKRIHSRSLQDPGTAGDEGEQNWAKLMEDWLPEGYHVRTKGRLISHDGRMSPQADVVVLKPSYPKKLLEKRIWLADGVAAVFECKTTLKAAHVSNAVNRAVSFKNTVAHQEGSPRRELRSPLVCGLLAHSHDWKAENSLPEENIRRAYDSATANVEHPSKLLDILCVADLGNWSQSIVAMYKAEWIKNSTASVVVPADQKWWIATGFVGSSKQSPWQTESFQPIGAFIWALVSRFSDYDESLRDLARYYRGVGLGGSGQGAMKFWSAQVLSLKVRDRLEAGDHEGYYSQGDWGLNYF